MLIVFRLWARCRAHRGDWLVSRIYVVASLGSALFSTLFLMACNERYWVCSAVDEAQIRLLPYRLSETGLYDTNGTDHLAQDVLSYRPQFALWSDGAEKKRWVRLPEDSRIDTDDMDNWRFAVGTRFWKEFTRDGIRVETRMMTKIGADDDAWAFIAYLWNDQENDAFAVPYGAIDARGTPHDVPAANECASCHRGRVSMVLGFSAIQLAAPADAGEIALTELAARNRLTSPPARPIVLPGDEIERAALGYLHANCGDCHNRDRPSTGGPRCFEPRNTIDAWLLTSALGSPEQTPTYRTIFDRFAEPGDPDRSELIRRISRRGFGQMPCVGSDRIDEEGVALLRRWISER